MRYAASDSRPHLATPPIHLGQRLAKGIPQHLVCYGTSLTSHGAWVAQVADELRLRFGELCRVTNSGEGRQTSRWGVEHFEPRVVALRPDAVTLEFAINDSLARLSLSLDEARGNLLRMIDRLAEALPDCQVILQVMNPAVGRPLGHTGHRPHLDDYEAMYREVAGARGLPLIDHAKTWADVLADGEARFLEFVPDGLHPNEEGCRRFVTPTVLRALLEGAASAIEPAVTGVGR